jgi:hypothetical protein
MARYFLNLHERGTVLVDEDGVDRPGLEAARTEALRTVRAIMSSDVNEGHLCLSGSVEVMDDAGQTVATVPFKDAIMITGV